MLIKSFASWERTNGRKISKAGMEILLKNNPELSQATNRLLLSWIEAECHVLWRENKESRFKRLGFYFSSVES
jgi:hypothetical protein